jgi:photoactive yellow protein
MLDAPDPDASDDPSPDDSDREEYVQQWNALCDELGTSDPNEVLARVQTLKRQVQRGDDQDSQDEGLVTISEVEQVFREMNAKIDKLRERNAALAERLEGDGGEDGEALKERYQKVEALLDTLGVTTIDDAQDRVRRLNQQIEGLYQEQEILAEAGLSDAEAAVEEIDALRRQRDHLQDERERLQEERDQLEAELDEREAPSAASEAPDTSVLEAAVVIRDQVGVSSPDEAKALTQIVESLYERVQEQLDGSEAASDDAPDDVLGRLRAVSRQIERLSAETAPADALPAEAGEILGIRSVEDARELEGLIDEMSDRLDRLRTEQAPLEAAGLSADDALTMIRNMEAQLVDLYHHSGPDENGRSESHGPSGLELDAPLRERIEALLGSPLSAADDMTEVVRGLVDRLETRSAEQDALDEAGLDPGEAVALIESMEAQLNDLYAQTEEQQDAARRLAAIEDVLGISTRQEAEELAAVAHHMEDQLTTLYDEKEKLQELGLTSIEDAVDMIESMETQLTELYEDKEALRGLDDLDSTEQQSTFQQLEALYAERQKLQEALGVSSAEDVIEMVETLESQLDDLYTTRDADADPEERFGTLLEVPGAAPPEAAASTSPDEEASDDASAGDPSTAPLTINSMEQQLEALYREKELLLRYGFGSVEEAVTQLQTQQRQIDALQRENHTYEQRFERLQSALGTAHVPRILEMVRALESASEVPLDAVRPDPSEEETDYEVNIGATSPLVPPDTLDRLDDMSAAELEGLDVGAVRLDDEGVVEALNEQALRLPGLREGSDPEAVVGQNFFLDLAPSTNNNLFYGRFQKGQRQGEMDARFPYTFTGPGEESQPFAVQLYRAPEGNATWLLFRPSR